MANIDVASLLRPVTEAAPCGPDLDLDGDMEFLNFLARAEGVLPTSFLSFRRESVDFAAELATIGDFSQQTRDLRLLVLHAKLSILNRDLDGFANALDAVVALLAERWDEVHPRGEDGDFGLRVAVVQALDDLPHVVLPIQEVPLVRSRRFGPVTYRMWLIADEKVEAREGEAILDAATIERVFTETDVDVLVALRDRIAGIDQAAAALEQTSIARAGYRYTITLPRLRGLLEPMITFLDQQVARLAPSAALSAVPVPADADAVEDGGDLAPSAAPGASPAPGIADARPGIAVATRPQAVAAIRAAGAYFRRYEPSSPTLLLVNFADRLMGKPFYEVLRLMMPRFAGEAEVRLAQNAFRLTYEHVTETVVADSGFEEGMAIEASEEGPEIPQVDNRREALRLLEQVTIFLRGAEPSSPIPLVLTRARDFAERDFASLMKDMFSDPILKAMADD
ncbi:type VI secretion system ImpA family N-terminal domain-containing protein [Ancylobacter sp. 6x-1]|uniref:Type VI secretion system ImpA family N-terminal domain-containing protein n=1 Tax=Ancylobacter crimeensis TaxID=2579147 RepID=A0ABT0D7K7_9HYPH|nr:type VI secretion system ImpA family N-terminal domain-containing protein [Ancylobacter crimeensis]MCK0195924.1 type VI secretion system ImpA family N-terminal domain-containing protein [Ancylobacter crimeensis]